MDAPSAARITSDGIMASPPIVASTEIAAPRRAVQPVRVDTRVEDLIAVAADQNFVPVVDDKDDFIGIVTRSRILKYCLEQYFVATVY